jgi:hypothetical protein
MLVKNAAFGKFCPLIKKQCIEDKCSFCINDCCGIRDACEVIWDISTSVNDICLNK